MLDSSNLKTVLYINSEQFPYSVVLWGNRAGDTFSRDYSNKKFLTPMINASKDDRVRHVILQHQTWMPDVRVDPHYPNFFSPQVDAWSPQLLKKMFPGLCKVSLVNTDWVNLADYACLANTVDFLELRSAEVYCDTEMAIFGGNLATIFVPYHRFPLRGDIEESVFALFDIFGTQAVMPLAEQVRRVLSQLSKCSARDMREVIAPFLRRCVYTVDRAKRGH